MRCSPIALSLGTVGALLASPARADIPPSADSPDAHCSPAEQCPSGEFCPYEFKPSDPEASRKVGAGCRSAAQSRGLKQRCRSGGNYRGEDLYCPPDERGSWGGPGSEPAPTPAIEPEAPAKAAMCALGDGPGDPALALLGLVWSLRTRRRPQPRAAESSRTNAAAL